MWIVIGWVPSVTGILETVAVHARPGQLQCCMLHVCCSVAAVVTGAHVVVVLTVSLVDIVSLLIGQRVISACGWSGAGAALLIAQVHGLIDHLASVASHT